MSRARVWAVLLAAVATGAGVLALMSPASGAVNEGVCPGVHVDPPGEPTSVTITAPAGFLISSVCVKAGSIQQGDGPEIVTYSPPVASVTFEHSSGKAISHYAVTYVPVGTSTTPTTSGDDPPTTTTTTCPDCTPGTLVITTTTTAPGATSTTPTTSAPPAPPAPNPGPAPIAPAPVGGPPYAG